MRRAASDAFQWMEATDALKRAAGSRARLPKLELLTEGTQVMFWEPPAHRKGLSRRHGAIKRVWVRYRNKLKGMPLEFVRMTVAEEQEAQIAKAALEELEEQIRTGRANAEKVSSSSSSSSSTSSDEEKNDKKPTSSSQDAPIEEQQVWEFSDEELEASDPIPEQQVRQSASCLDDLPMALHRKNASGLPGPSRPQKKARTEKGAQPGKIQHFDPLRRSGLRLMRP